ncbi:hypothetical protein HZI30_01335 [Serratia fonticola]|uniref:hypothetical protein n=1 Tax=Serratia fonticola TaxID=47917 RepID=UPI0015C682E6|nr:hypothetical protein [Serratia fonticola]NXZ85576.1 hypothetical protein [Serratia fonticola]
MPAHGGGTVLFPAWLPTVGRETFAEQAPLARWLLTRRGIGVDRFWQANPARKE